MTDSIQIICPGVDDALQIGLDEVLEGHALRVVHFVVDVLLFQYLADDDLSEEAQMKMMMDAKEMSGRLYDEFKRINGGLLCRDLRGDMMLTCAKYVTDVIGILENSFKA